MEFNIDKVQSGKTHKAVEWVKEGRIDNKKDSSNRILVVSHEDMKKVMQDTWDLGYHEIETFRTIKNYYKGTLRNKELWIDRIEDFISFALPRTNIIGVNGENK